MKLNINNLKGVFLQVKCFRFCVVIFFTCFINKISAQDTIHVYYYKTTKGCYIQNPAVQTANLNQTKQCGELPEVDIDSIKREHDNFKGFILAKWFYKSSYSDSVFKAELLEVNKGIIVNQKKYYFNNLREEEVTSDSAIISIEYSNMRKIESVKTAYFLPVNSKIGNKEYSCSTIEKFFEEDGRMYNKIYECKEGRFVEYIDFEGEVLIHYFTKNNFLYDVISGKCLFINKKGDILDKDEFINKVQMQKIINWDIVVLEQLEQMELAEILFVETGFDVYKKNNIKKLVKKIKKIAKIN